MNPTTLIGISLITAAILYALVNVFKSIKELINITHKSKNKLKEILGWLLNPVNLFGLIVVSLLILNLVLAIWFVSDTIPNDFYFRFLKGEFQ